MNCHDNRGVLHAYTDGELDLLNAIEVEKHLRDCEPCAAVHGEIVALRTVVRDTAPYFRAPLSLERRVRSSFPRRASLGRLRTFFAAAAAVVLVVGCVWAVVRSGGGGAERSLAAEVVSAHVRSLMAEHLWDVKSTDRHTVKPWFDGKLDFAPDVRDFKDESFSLEGGRLDYLTDRPVAALVYKHGKHYVNLFIWPATGRSDEGEHAFDQRGYALEHWVRAGMNYWAVTDASDETLKEFTSAVRDRRPTAATGPGR